ncbi:MAG: thrombospondin type 3 repeat-containing protein [Minisyncoccia bacterium]
MKLINEKYKKYLPSKKFTYIFVACIVVLLIILIISNIFFSKNTFISLNKKNNLENQNLTINNLLQKDSDNDGVMDWEEALWGTDPNKEISFNGIKDSDYIKQKRSDLNLSENSETAQNDGELTETDKFAQQFFASLSVMKQNGQIDKNTINNVSTALGQSIVDPNLIDKYTEKDMNLSQNDGVNEQEIYYKNAKNIFETYKKEGIGGELEIVGDIVSSGKTENEQDSIKKLATIASAYEGFAEKMVELEVPGSLEQYHFKIINSANNTGVSVRSMIKIIDDPIIGLSGLSQYQKYSDDLISSVGNLEKILSNNGIMIE